MKDPAPPTLSASSSARASATTRSRSAAGRNEVHAGGWWLSLHWVALGGVLVLNLLLSTLDLGRLGDGNTYYAATVRSMMTGWANFFFVSFDPGGFVTVDKPPVAFWLQTASAKVFGFNGVSLMIPEIVAGFLSVLLLYHLVARAFGPWTGVLGALAFAVTPVTVLTDRSNLVESVLVLAVLCSMWAALKAAETARIVWLLAAVALMGVAFNIKMLEAFLALPAILIVYLYAARLQLRTRLRHLVTAAAVLVVVSLSWITAVDLIPAGQRPFVGSSGNNTELGLALGYNGLGRLLGQTRSFTSPGGVSSGNVGALSPKVALTSTFIPGPQRLVEATLGGQAGWFIVLAVIGLAGMATSGALRPPFDRKHQAVVTFGAWFLTSALYVSVAGTVHAYYLAMLGPPAAALFAIGVAALWRSYRSPGARGWLLPGALAAAGAAQMLTLSYFSVSYRWALAIVLTACMGGTMLIIGCRLARITSAPLLAMWIGVASLFLAPTLWDAYTVTAGKGGAAAAGPRPLSEGNRSTADHSGQVQVTMELVRYLEAHRARDTFQVGTFTSGPADAIIIGSGLPVMDLGGYKGWDRILNTRQLAARIRKGSVRYFLTAADGSGAGVNADLEHWVVAHCSLVPPASYGPIPEDALYHCR